MTRADDGESELWVKIVGMLQQNWARIEISGHGGVRISFITDAGGVFDAIAFDTEADAIEALERNGFQRLAGSLELQSLLRPPQPPFQPSVHPNGPIYSSGRFWL